MKHRLQSLRGRGKQGLALLLTVTVLMLSCSTWSTIRTEAEEQTITEKFVIPIQSMNLRSEPNLNDDDNILLMASGSSGGTVGMLLRYVSETSDWYKVELPEGTIAYARKLSSYVKVEEISYTKSEYEAYCKELEEEGFPESYWQKLFYLHKLYPEWIFQAQKTGLDWEAAVTAESKLGLSLTYSFYPTSWKSTQSGAYNWETDSYVSLDSGGWNQASTEAVAFCLDPRNWLGTETIFQFISQSFDEATQTKDVLAELVSGTFLAEEVEDTDGEMLSYVDVLYEAGAEFGVSPYVLAAMILQEQGNAGTGGCISGDNSKYPGYFNFFNIGAYQSGGMTAVERGLWYAQGGNDGATSWQRPWNTRSASIRGGAEWYADGYINEGQDTLYLKKFNVQGSKPYTHQYMTNITGAISESVTLSSGYNETMRSLPLVFKIPVYENMPEKTTVPVGTGSPNNLLKEITVDGTALGGINTGNIGDIVVPYDTTSVTIKATGYSSKATIQGTGTVALTEETNDITLVVTAQNGDVKEYTFTIAKEAAPTLIVAEPPYSVKDETWMYLSLGVTLDEFIAQWNTEEWAEVSVNVPSEEEEAPSGETILGTGLVVTAKEATSDRTVEYTLVVLGDVNGDGKVTNTDRIRIRNYILETGTFSTEAAFMAADVNNDGKVTNSDRIRVRNYILGTGTLE